MHRENIFDLFNQQQAEAAKAAQTADVVTPAQVHNEDDIVRPEPDKQAPAQPAAQPATPAQPAEPAQPATPAQPAEPAQPATPAQPAEN